MRPVKQKDTAQELEPSSWEFWEDDCGLSDLARSEFGQAKTEDARSSDRTHEPKGN
jgi:hypothetical protein